MADLQALKDKKTGGIVMRNPDGKSYAVPENLVQESLNQGWQLENPQQAAVREYVSDNKGFIGSAKVFGGQLVDELALGLPEMIYNKTADPLDVARKEGLKKDHNVSNALGGTLGFAGSFVTGAPLIKGATASGNVASKALQKAFTAKLLEQGVKQAGIKGAAKKLAAKTIEKTAALATEGAIYSAPYAITEASLAEDVDTGERFGLAAESIAAGGLLGGALGLVGPSLGALSKTILKPVKGIVKPVIDPIKKQLSPKDVAVNIYDPTPTEIRKFENKFNGMMKKHPEFAKDKGDYKDELLKITKKVGMDIDTVAPDEFLPRVQTYLDDSVKQLDDLALSAEGTVSSRKVGKNIISELETMKKDIAKGVGGTRDVEKVQDVIDELGEKLIAEDRQMTAQELLQLKRSTADNIKFNKQPGTRTATEKSLNKVVSAFDNGIEDLVKQSDATLENAWRNKNLEISMLIDVIEPLKRKSGRDIKRPFAGVGNVSAAGGGALLGGALGGAIGDENAAAFGALGGIALSPLFRNYRNYGILYSENAMKKIAGGLDTIPKALKLQINKGKDIVPKVYLKSGTRLLGDTKQKRLEEYERIKNRVLEFSEDPEYAANQIGEVTGILSETGAPQIAEAFARKNALMAKYFGEQVPKAKNPDKPYYKTKYVPSDTELSSFERKLRVIQDPFSVIDDLGSGSLTEDAVQTLQNVYPALFKRIQGKIIDSLMEEKEDVPYETRLQLALILQEATDPSLENIGLYQQTFVTNENQQGQKSSIRAMDLPSLKTETQRVTNK